MTGAAPPFPEDPSPCKIGVVGCGALGSFYAAHLARTGHHVHCLLRSDLAAVRTHGFRIQSAQGDFVARPQVAANPAEIGECDVVLIGLKTTANHAFPALVSPLVGPNTAVVTLQNGLGNEEQLARLCGVEHVLGGLCFVCLNRVGPGEIVHSAHGRIVLGEAAGPARARTHGIAGCFRRAGIRCDVVDHLPRARWEKLVWNIPFNGLGVAGAAGLPALESGRLAPGAALGPCLSTQDLLGDERWEKWVWQLMREIIATANALGLGVAPGWADLQVERTRTMGPYRASTLIDFERGLPLELDSLFLRPLAAAHKAGVPVPCLERLCAVLDQLDPANLQR